MCASQQGSNKNRFPRTEEKTSNRDIPCKKLQPAQPPTRREIRRKNIVADKSFGTGRWIVFCAVYNNLPWFLVIAEEVVEERRNKRNKNCYEIFRFSAFYMER